MFSIFQNIPQLILLLSLCGLSGGCVGLESPGSGSVAGPEDMPQTVHYASSQRLTDYRMPSSLSLCGERLDLSKRAVYERLEYEFSAIVHHPAQVELWRRRAQRYFPLIEARLKAAGLPDDIKYLAVCESDLRPWVASPAGALGIWQFMPGTARQFGLTVNNQIDTRQLPDHLLGAGERYLSSLYQKFGSWSLAMAAYNCGDGRLARALSSQGTRDYYQLDLPRETERYVYRIAAIKAILENQRSYDFGLPVPQNHYQATDYSEISVSFPSSTSWAALAEQAGTTYKNMRLLNPHIMTGSLAGGPYLLRVPKGAETNF